MVVAAQGRAVEAPAEQDVRASLDLVLASERFSNSPRLSAFLRYVVNHTLAGKTESLKEYSIAMDVFGRPASFDPRLDTIVRVQAGRLRKRLDEYYASANGTTQIRIDVPRGGYAAVFRPLRAEELEAPEEIGASAGPPGASERKRRWWTGACLAGAVLGAVGWWVARAWTPMTDLKSTTLTAYPHEEFVPSLSPDGSEVAFGWNGETSGRHELYRLTIGENEPVRLTHSPEMEYGPAWSPDAAQLAFLRDRGDGVDVYLIDRDGANERLLTRLVWRSRTIDWSPDGRFLAVEEQPAEGEPVAIYFVSTVDGSKRRVTVPADLTENDAWPRFSPDGRHLAFARGPLRRHAYVVALTPDGFGAKLPRRVTSSEAFYRGLAWTPRGDGLVFGGILGAGGWQLFRVDVGSTPNEPVQMQTGGNSPHTPTTSRGRSRRMVYATSAEDSDIRLLPGPAATTDQVRRAQTPGRELNSHWDDLSPSYSPDASRLALSTSRSRQFQIWIADENGTNPVQFTTTDTEALDPAWSRDGKWLAFDAVRDGDRDIYIAPVRGGRARRLTNTPVTEMMPTFSADGKWVYYRRGEEIDTSIWKVPIGGGPARRVTEAGVFEAREGPDGRWLYYVKRYFERGEPGVFRRPVHGGLEERVLDVGRTGWWSVTQSGIYVLREGGIETPPTLDRYQFADGSVTQVHEFALGTRFSVLNSLSVSWDDRRIAYVVMAHVESDLMLVEGFR